MGPFGRSGVWGGAGSELIGRSWSRAIRVRSASRRGPGKGAIPAYPVTSPLVVIAGGTSKYWLVIGTLAFGPNPKPFAAVHRSLEHVPDRGDGPGHGIR